MLVAAPMTFDWASAAVEFPILEQFVPLAKVPAGPIFVKLGGKCWPADAAGKLALGEGARDNHVWHWTARLSLTGSEAVLEGPSLVHGLDRPGDTRTFERKGPKKRFVHGPVQGDVLPLHEKAWRLELACWGKDESTATCNGKKVSCARCSVLRLLGGPIGGQRVYGDGVIRADLDKGCDRLCEGPGLAWRDFEALASFVAKTPVVHVKEPPAGALYRTREACEAGSGDLAPEFAGGEPQIPKK